jgi:hypothetical protein
VPVIEAMREAAVLTEDEEFFCRVVLALEAGRELQEAEGEQAIRLEDLLQRYGGEVMARLYRDDRAEFTKRYQRGSRVTVRL